MSNSLSYDPVQVTKFELDERLRNVIKSLSRGLTELELVLEESTTPQSLAKSLDVDRTTAYRILNTLAAHEFVVRDPLDDQYVANIRKVFSFAHSVVGKLHFPTLATPYLERLRAKTGEAASLAVLQDTVVVYVNHLPSEEAITVAPMLGVRRPIHVSAVGKAIWSHLAPADQNRIFDLIEWKALTRKTLTDVDEMRAEMRVTRDRGYAVDDEETFEGVRCVAAPVRDHRDEIIAAMGISGPSTRLSMGRVHDFGAYLRDLSHDFSVSLGAPDTEDAWSDHPQFSP